MVVDWSFVLVEVCLVEVEGKIVTVGGVFVEGGRVVEREDVVVVGGLVGVGVKGWVWLEG